MTSKFWNICSVISWLPSIALMYSFKKSFICACACVCCGGPAPGPAPGLSDAPGCCGAPALGPTSGCCGSPALGPTSGCCGGPALGPTPGCCGAPALGPTPALSVKKKMSSFPGVVTCFAEEAAGCSCASCNIAVEYLPPLPPPS